MKTFAALALASIIAATTGCASIMNGSDQPIAITSEPAGANFEVRDENGRMVHQGVTPNTVSLKSGAGYFKAANYDVRVYKEGYYPANATIRPGISGWYWGNFIFGGLIGGLGVDPATGAMYKIPESSNSLLTPMAVKVSTK